MIRRLLLVRNVGQFDSVADGRDLPLEQLTLVYSENGRGKTTLAAVIRSLATGDPLPITERRRLGAPADPEVIVDLGPDGTAVFRDAEWTGTTAAVVFDDRFVDENVYSGLAVEAGHRQNLHEVVLGTEAVDLARRLQEIVDRIEAHNRALREQSSRIRSEWLNGLPVDSFCDLPRIEDVDARIAEAERNLAVSRDRELVRTTPALERLRLPAFDVDAARTLLRRGLPTLQADALERLRRHFGEIGPGGEQWVAEGMRRVRDHGFEGCPFCGQGIGHEAIASNYDSYFSDAYQQLVQTVAEALAQVERHHSGDAQATFEREVRLLGERRRFWADYASLPGLELDTTDVAAHWRAARDVVIQALGQKRARPLEEIDLSADDLLVFEAYEADRASARQLNVLIDDANVEIAVAKERSAVDTADLVGGDLMRLKAARNRHTAEAAGACRTYLEERGAKAATERERDAARGQLDELRATSFPRYEDACNRYLERLNADFRLGGVTSVNTRGGPAVTYNLVVNGRPISVGGGEQVAGNPSFATALSSGDRTTLALAFFLASLDGDARLAEKLVVIDDPISSLDDQRTRATVREIRNLRGRCSQLMLLSHHRTFLCAAWESMARVDRAAIEIVRAPSGSSLRPWDVDAASATEHDRRHVVFSNYLRGNYPSLRAVAGELRPHLEAYLRVSRPGEFPPGTLIGPFLGTCRDRLTAGNPVLQQERVDELQDLLDFANRFHHDTNPAWDAEPITDGELRGMVVGVLRFVGS
jgi:wobble nucleotide-excising tRNase